MEGAGSSPRSGVTGPHWALGAELGSGIEDSTAGKAPSAPHSPSHFSFEDRWLWDGRVLAQCT